MVSLLVTFTTSKSLQLKLVCIFSDKCSSLVTTFGDAAQWEIITLTSSDVNDQGKSELPIFTTHRKMCCDVNTLTSKPSVGG